jgi:hypothetical protein
MYLSRALCRFLDGWVGWLAEWCGSLCLSVVITYVYHKTVHLVTPCPHVERKVLVIAEKSTQPLPFRPKQFAYKYLWISIKMLVVNT